jgi:hypothetical protein
MRKTVLTNGQNLYNAVLHTRLAFQALRFIDTDHSCIPPIPPPTACGEHIDKKALQPFMIHSSHLLSHILPA